MNAGGVDAGSSPAAVVDVIIPAFNAARFIEDALHSVLQQSWLPDRIIVVDDGSTDDTAERVRGVGSARIELLSVEHGGVSRARNIGVKRSTADYVAFLDADDRWLAKKLERQLACLQQHKARACYSLASSIDEQGRPVANVWDAIWGAPHNGEGLFRALLYGRTAIMGSASSVIVERDFLLQEAGLFDERISYDEDFDLWLRIASKTGFVYVDAYDVQLRQNPNSKNRSPDKNVRQHLLDMSYVRNKYAREHVFPARFSYCFHSTLFIGVLRSGQNKIAALRSFHAALRRDCPDFCAQLGATFLAFAGRVLCCGLIHISYASFKKIKIALKDSMVRAASVKNPSRARDG